MSKFYPISWLYPQLALSIIYSCLIYITLGLPTKSPFVRTDCTIKHNGEIYVVGAIKGVAEMSLYKTDREESVNNHPNEKNFNRKFRM